MASLLNLGSSFCSDRTVRPGANPENAKLVNLKNSSRKRSCRITFQKKSFRPPPGIMKSRDSPCYSFEVFLVPKLEPEIPPSVLISRLVFLVSRPRVYTEDIDIGNPISINSGRRDLRREV